MKTNEKNVIFSTEWFEDEQYLNEERAFLTDDLGIKSEDIDEDMLQSIVNDNINICLEDARMQLSELDLRYDKIFVDANLGLWNGRRSGYNIINTDEVLYTDCDYATWYCENGNFKFEGHHHDGSNYYTYYGIKDIYEFEDDVEKYGLTNKVKEKHLVNLGDEVSKLCYL